MQASRAGKRQAGGWAGRQAGTQAGRKAGGQAGQRSPALASASILPRRRLMIMANMDSTSASLRGPRDKIARQDRAGHEATHLSVHCPRAVDTQLHCAIVR